MLSQSRLGVSEDIRVLILASGCAETVPTRRYEQRLDMQGNAMRSGSSMAICYRITIATSHCVLDHGTMNGLLGRTSGNTAQTRQHGSLYEAGVTITKCKRSSLPEVSIPSEIFSFICIPSHCYPTRDATTNDQTMTKSNPIHRSCVHLKFPSPVYIPNHWFWELSATRLLTGLSRSYWQGLQ